MATMTASKKKAVIVIDPDEKKAKEIRKMLEKSMENIAIINTRCLFSRYHEINKLICNNNYRKMFYGCNIKFFNEMTERFDLKCGESIYLGKWLDISKIVRHYWNQKG